MSKTPKKKTSGTGQMASELEYLKFFYRNADFGPADRSVRASLDRRFQEKTGMTLPPGYGQCDSCGCCPDDCECDE